MRNYLVLLNRHRVMNVIAYRSNLLLQNQFLLGGRVHQSLLLLLKIRLLLHQIRSIFLSLPLHANLFLGLVDLRVDLSRSILSWREISICVFCFVSKPVLTFAVVLIQLNYLVHNLLRGIPPSLGLLDLLRVATLLLDEIEDVEHFVGCSLLSEELRSGYLVGFYSLGLCIFESRRRRIASYFGWWGSLEGLQGSRSRFSLDAGGLIDIT